MPVFEHFSNTLQSIAWDVDWGEIIDFVVQYETFINGKWFSVVRYDTSHGFAHRDILSLKGEKRKTPIFVSDKNDALTFAENDIKDNWEVYKQRFIQEAKRWEKENW